MRMRANRACPQPQKGRKQTIRYRSCTSMAHQPLGVWSWKDLPSGEERGDWIDWASIERRRRTGRVNFGLEYSSSHLQKTADKKFQAIESHCTLRYQQPKMETSEEKQLNRPWLPASVTRGDTSRHGASLLSTLPPSVSLAKRQVIQRAIVETLGLTRSELSERKRNIALMTNVKAGDEKMENDEKITLQHIKEAVLRYDDSHQDMSNVIAELMRSVAFEDLLVAVILYFESFFKVKELEDKEKQIENHELNPTDKKDLFQWRQKLEHRYHHLANKYSSVVLGMHMTAGLHHTAAGQWRSSRTHFDKRMYEAVYDFLILAVWLTFSQNHWQAICMEIGRVFRTETFNMPSRLCSATANDSLRRRSNSSLLSSQRISKRVPHHLLASKSPVMTSILQTPKDRALWLFGNHTMRQKRERAYSSPARLVSLESLSTTDLESSEIILGKFLRDYDSTTLTRIEQDECDKALKESNLRLPLIEKEGSLVA